MSVKDILLQNEPEGVSLFRSKIAPLGLSEGATEKLVSMFIRAFSANSDTQFIWDFVKPLTKNEQFPYEELSEPTDPQSLLKQLVVVKLNGGLGTTMGCTVPKSVIHCAEGKTFFDFTIDQIREVNQQYNVDVPLVLMHSFYTDDLMKKHLEGIEGVRVLTFNQNKFPRIYEDTLEPVPSSASSPLSEWNPPGHGDVYHCLRDSGLLDQLLAEGKKYMFISNIDNLGAKVDIKILNKLIAENRSYAAETVLKTPDDWKGGMPVLYKGRVKLLETAQVPAGHMEDFTNVKIFDIFHSNNLWINLPTLKKALDEDTLLLDVILNRKKYNGRNIIQLEAAAGSAIQSFTDSIAVKVPRSRFLPVKSCNELLLMRSDLYVRTGPNFHLNSERTVEGLPSIKLSSHFCAVCDFERRFQCIPSIKDLEMLEIDGDVSFGEAVTLKGKVVIRVEQGKSLFVCNNTLENQKIEISKL